VVRLRALAHFNNGRSNYSFIKYLLQTITQLDGSIIKLYNESTLPRNILTTLILLALKEGYLRIDEEKIILEPDCRNAVEGGQLDSFLRANPGSHHFEFVMDLSTGMVHKYAWLMSHRCNDKNVRDVTLQTEIDSAVFLENINEKTIRELIMNSNGGDLSDANNPTRIAPNRIERIDHWEIMELFDIAINFREVRSREITRWLAESDTPLSVIDALRVKKPELFKAAYSMVEGSKAWQPSPSTLLLEEIDNLWENVQNAVLTRVEEPERRKLSRKALEKIRSIRKEWNELEKPYSDVKSIKVWAGPAEIQGRELSNILNRVRKKVVILTSFLNEKYSEWVAEILSKLPGKAEVLFLYGHANNETQAEQKVAIEQYISEISKSIRSDIKLSYGLTTKKSHEKIFITDTGDSVVGSWNLCSSNPNSEHMEIGLRVKSKKATLTLCDVLKTEVEGESAKFIEQIGKSLPKTKGNKGSPLGRRLLVLENMLESALDMDREKSTLELWRRWREQLLGLRDLIWTHFDSPPITIISAESTRDAFVQLVRTSHSSILIATDRVNYNGLDASLTQHLLEKERLIRIIWGMESPDWDLREDTEAQEELNVASETLRTLLKNGNGNVLTSLFPMLNHSKLLIVDENRVLVSSSNFLAKGMEPTDETSREIGILVESPLLARQLLGRLMLHSKDIRGKVDMRSRTGQPWDIFEILRESLEELWANENITARGRPDLVDFAIQSTFREFTEDGRIVGSENGKYSPTDADLSERWEACMKFFGKNKLKQRTKTMIPLYEEYFMMHACEMIGIQKLGYGTEYSLRPRSKGTFVSLPKHNFKLSDDSSREPFAKESIARKSRELSEDRTSEALYNLRIGKDRTT
jgi:hypothetical protein